MSAMPATELTCDSDIAWYAPSARLACCPALGTTLQATRRALSRRARVPARHAGRSTRRACAPARHAGRAIRPRPRDTPVAPLRLTRRGRVVVALAAALLVTVVSLLLAGVAQATNDGPSPRAARENLVQVIVRPGQSLWSVAESADPDQDTRAVIQQIIDLNSLNGDTVFAGQQLWVPRG